ncbi:hypothetical protein M422DRAFT_265960 [Sphaerobolus stellatus SS14]|uniref:Uncharacterized protein n=1 Tax=Sphaerobolus stellatus (strain SS14) TaxID=990650 RepID=A0A0C9USR9_SPHS4|nr:hypothetical protein M422DRAFT_265960 [Sphaerobolus stellatus SS14]
MSDIPDSLRKLVARLALKEKLVSDAVARDCFRRSHIVGRCLRCHTESNGGRWFRYCATCHKHLWLTNPLPPVKMDQILAERDRLSKAPKCASQVIQHPKAAQTTALTPAQKGERKTLIQAAQGHAKILIERNEIFCELLANLEGVPRVDAVYRLAQQLVDIYGLGSDSLREAESEADEPPRIASTSALGRSSSQTRKEQFHPTDIVVISSSDDEGLSRRAIKKEPFHPTDVVVISSSDDEGPSDRKKRKRKA